MRGQNIGQPYGYAAMMKDNADVHNVHPWSGTMLQLSLSLFFLITYIKANEFIGHSTTAAVCRSSASTVLYILVYWKERNVMNSVQA